MQTISTISVLKQTTTTQVQPDPSPVELAEAIFFDLRARGLRDKDIVTVSSELLSRLTCEIRERDVKAFEAAKAREEN